MNIDNERLEKLIKNRKLLKNLQALQDIVNRDDGITSISIIAGGKEVKFEKEKTRSPKLK